MSRFKRVANKRVSRLAANLPLLKHNLCPLTFLGVSEESYTQAVLGVYEMTRVELLRDMFVWAYERSTQEYLAIKQHLVEPDPLRLKYRDTLKAIVREVVLKAEKDTFGQIRALVAAQVVEADRDEVQALVVDEVRRLHEGVLARYGLRVSEWEVWKENQLLEKHKQGYSKHPITVEEFSVWQDEQTWGEKKPLAPATQSLLGIMKGTSIDEDDYKQHLEDKYL